MTSLRAFPCQHKCDWRPAGEVRDGGRLFACRGCGSEWLRTEPWTPRNADGTITPEVLAERNRGRRAPVAEA